MIANLEDKKITEIFKTSIIQQTAYWSEVEENARRSKCSLQL
ncbi:Uncharacterised protein [Sphingobacterium daejeonense]|nr:Uncharacterised protein [Sphingobacterium daejeonense]